MSRGALLATASIVTGLLAGPGVAYAADTSTELSAAEMAADLKAVSAASALEAAHGWKAAVKMTGDGLSFSSFFAVEPVAGVSYERFDFSGEVSAQYVVAGKGTYAALTDPESRAAVRMMGRPSVRYVFTPDKSGEGMGDGVSPGKLLTDGVEHAGTKTVHDDGSADYRFRQDGTTMTAHVTAAGILASAGSDGADADTKLTYGYGPQHLILPSASVTIGAAALAQGLAYLDMATAVQQVAGEAATDTLRAAHGHAISVSLLREVTRDDAEASNSDTGVRMIKAKNSRGGVRVYATNPWTHRTAGYTLRPSGRKVVIARN
jgi:hypothetical protein